MSASNFETLDGVDFAISDGGLFQVLANADGGPVGVWAQVPASTRDDAGMGGDLAATSLMLGTHQLFLATRWGTIYRVTLDGGL